MKELYTKNDILNQLNSFEIPKEKIVLIHTSLRSVGSIEGAEYPVKVKKSQNTFRCAGFFLCLSNWDMRTRSFYLLMDFLCLS